MCLCLSRGKTDGKQPPERLIKRPKCRKRGPSFFITCQVGDMASFLFSVLNFPGESEYFLPHRFALRLNDLIHRKVSGTSKWSVSIIRIINF